MAEYIEREELIAKMKKLFSPEVLQNATAQEIARAALILVECEPTADVAEVRHGKWEVVFDGNAKLYENMFECSVCKTTHVGHPNVGRYCPNCGAKMGDDEE